jgi:MFS family permease
MDRSPTNAQKIRALPWAISAGAANQAYVYLAFAGPVFLLFLDKLELDKTQIGLVLAIIPFCDLVAMFMAPAVARVGFKRCFLIAWATRKFVLALLIATPWILDAWGKAVAFGFVVTVILAFSLCRTVAQSALVPWAHEFVPNSVRGKFGAFQSMVFVVIGAAVLAAAGGFLGDDPQFGRFQVLFGAAFVVGLMSVGFYSLVPGGASIHGDAQQRSDFASMWEALRDRQFLLFLAVSAAVTLGWVPLSMSGFLPFFLKEQVGLESDQVLYFNSVLLGSGLLSCFVWGWASDRYGSKPVLWLTVVVLWLYPIGLWVLPRHDPSSFYATLAVGFVVGLVLPGWSVAYSRLLFVKLIPADCRTGYAVVHVAWLGLVGGLAPLVAGQVLKHTASLDGSIWFVKIDPYTPLVISSIVLMGVAMILLIWLEGDSDVPVARFAGMFIRGNPLAAMQALIAYQFGGVEQKRVSTIERLGKARSPLNVDELIAGLRDPGFNVRFEAVVSIARTRRDPKLTDALIDVLRAGEPDMRIAAAWALGRVGDRRAIAALRETIDSQYPLLRARAARALGTLGDEESATRLLERLVAEPDDGLKLAYASALGALRYPQALGSLLQLLASLEDEAQRRELALAVASIAGRDDWYVLLARRAEKDADDALGGVLLSMRRRLLHEVGTDAATRSHLRDLINRCTRAFGDNDHDEAVKMLRAIIQLVPLDRLSPSARTVLRDADAQLGRFGGQRLEYALLALHALHAGFGAAARDRQAGPT